MRSASLSCVIGLFLTAGALAADKVSLRLNLQPGMNWTFDQTQDMNTDSKATLNGQTQPFTVKMHSHRVGKAEVLAVSNGLPTSMRFTFGDGCESTMEMGGQQQHAPFPYAGKTVTVTRGPDGKVTDDFNGGQVDPQFLNELHGMLSQEEALYPKQPVGIGEEWAADPRLLGRDLQLAGDDRAGMTLKLLSVKGNIAEVKVSAAIVRTVNGMNTKAVMQGQAVVDLTSGHANKMDMKGTIDSKGQQQAPNGGAYQIEGTGTMATAMTADMIGGGGNGPGPAPVADNNAGGNPPTGGNPLGDGGGNPLGANPLGQNDPFIGRFSDGNLTVELAPNNGSYIGTFTLANNKYPAKGKANQQALDGSFDAGGNTFTFTAKLDGNTLTLITGGKTYTLKRAVVNPLGGNGMANPPDQPAPTAVANLGGAMGGPGALPNGYSVVTATDAGRALSTQKPTNSIPALLQSTLGDLAHYFDARPTIATAYEDVRDHHGGGLSFTASMQGQPVKGLISCKLDDKDAAVAVIYAKSSATPADWSKLVSGPAADAAGADGAAGSPRLREYDFPDGTGSIGLAEGWTTKSTSCQGVVQLDGPADQTIIMGFSVCPVTPNSTAVRMNQQLNAQARMMGGRPLPLGLFVAPLTGPVEALNNLMPQLSEASRVNHGPELALDHLKELKELPPMLPGGKAAVCEYGLTSVKDGQQKHHLCMAQVEVDSLPNTNESFLFFLSGDSAPDATFADDLPTMLAMTGSLKENAAVIAAQTREQIDEQNRRFAAQQAAHREVQAAFQSYINDQQRNSTIRSRSVDNFDEGIRGYRTVEDTATGERRSVDLGNVDQIVDTLNQYDPGRYKQIPLRDEADPLPPR